MKKLRGRIGQIVRSEGDEVIDSATTRRRMIFGGSGRLRQSLTEAAEADDESRERLGSLTLEARDDSRTGGREDEPLWGERAPHNGLPGGRQLDTIISLIAALLLGSLIVFARR
jgi:hypothetical protein